jgi:hypothetical protein
MTLVAERQRRHPPCSGTRRRRATSLQLVVVLVTLVGACTSSPQRSETTTTSSTATTAATLPSVDMALDAFTGLGTWVDAYDYSSAYQDVPGSPVPVTPSAVDDIARAGVKTLYLQAAKDDPRSQGDLVDRALVRAFLGRAHDAGLRVVAWYLPTHTDTEADVRRFRAMTEVEVDGKGFDGFGLDMEWTEGQSDIDVRNAELISLTKQAREIVGSRGLAAIVFAPVAIEVINPMVWPRFPYAELAPLVDLWMPMTYWTFREGPYRDPYLYVSESVDRLRADVGDNTLAVHPIGGIGDESTDADYETYLKAVAITGSIGASIYDWNTTRPAAWAVLNPE